MSEDLQFLTRAEVDELHEDSLRAFGGISGVRDDSLVESAMGAALNEHFYGGGDVFAVALPTHSTLRRIRPSWTGTNGQPPLRR